MEDLSNILRIMQQNADPQAGQFSAGAVPEMEIPWDQDLKGTLSSLFGAGKVKGAAGSIGAISKHRRKLNKLYRDIISPNWSQGRMPGATTFATAGENLARGIQHGPEFTPQQPPPNFMPSDSGLSALLPALTQTGQSGALSGAAQQIKSGFDKFLDTNEEMGRYFLDL